MSTGAIIASFLGFHKKSIAEVEHTYKEIGSKIFTQTWYEGNLGYLTSHSYYNTNMYEDILKRCSLKIRIEFEQSQSLIIAINYLNGTGI